MDFRELCSKFGVSCFNYEQVISSERLSSIFDDYQAEFQKISSHLNDAINGLRSSLPDYFNAHVTGRFKDPEHLILKVIRDANEAYGKADLTRIKRLCEDDFRVLFKDILGLRVILLRKSRKPDALKSIIDSFPEFETIKAFYVEREGEPEWAKPFSEKFGDDRFKLCKRGNDAPYGGIHIILPASCLCHDLEGLSCEIQVRSYFEEAWGEVDHDLKYPFRMNDPFVLRQMSILNQISYTADELIDSVYQLRDRFLSDNQIIRAAVAGDGISADIAKLVKEKTGNDLPTEVVREIKKMINDALEGREYARNTKLL